MATSNDAKCTSQEGNAPTPDAFVVEEIDDLEIQHDQLPNVEEYKASNDIQSHGSISKKMIMYTVGIISVLALSITGIVVAAKNKQENQSKSVYTPVGRTQQIEEFLFTNKISTLPQLQEFGTTHHLAAAFIADGDSLQLGTDPANAKRLIERFVLALTYYHFDGPKWSYDLRFLSGRDHCDWNDYFETKSGKIIRQGVICNEEGYVVELDLSWNNLRGSQLPMEIGHLSELETLHMHYNQIGGEFPDTFRKLTSLKSIALMKSGLTGTIPNWIGEMTQLTTLALGDNQMHGEIPESIESLMNLRVLGLDGNNGFTGSIGKLKKLRNLEALYLENNALTGNLHNFNWPNLKELDVSNNSLDESVPVELFNHPNLQVLDIHGNMMFGGFPDDIFENTKLEYFAAHNAGFEGTVPDRIAFLKSLKHLDISFNGLAGKLPDTITQMTNLHYLATAGNHFEAQPIMDMSKLTNLKELSMKSNNVIGTIPEWIGGLTNLRLLDFDANELTGTIPSWIGLLRSLDILLLNRNKLTGTIPSQIQNMHGLALLLLDGNSITGNANAICDSENVNPAVFVADCYPGTEGERPEIECRCCTQCCTDDDPDCNDKKWTSNIDLIWEYGYVRQNYTFNLLENAPVAFSKASDNADEDYSGGLR
jgi:Leucine-rich repeat (LRR) protein